MSLLHDAPGQQASHPQRRALMIAAGVALANAAWPRAAAAHDTPGLVVPPRDMPSIALVLDDGSRGDLRTLLAGRATALQFVLTGCSAVCPLLGAIFAQTQQRLAADGPRNIQLLSISLDPLGDTPPAMRQWLKGMGAGPQWRGAIPALDQPGVLEAWRTLGAGTAERDKHSAAVMLIDQRARLVFRTEDLPDSAWLARTLSALSQSAS